MLQKVRLSSIFRHNRYIIILVAAMCGLTGFARAADNRTFNRFYKLSPEEFKNQLNEYILNNQTDSAMLCANIQAEKYGKKELTTEEIKACCIAFRCIGLGYMQSYNNYPIAAENYLKAEQIADKYGFEPLRSQIAVDKAALTAMQNDLENNFVYNKKVMDDFKKAFYHTLEQTKSNNTEYNKIIMEMALLNMLYLAIKFDKTSDVANEIQIYQDARKRYGVCCNIDEVFCDAIDSYNAGNYDQAFEALQTPINHHPDFNEKDYIQFQPVVTLAQYYILFKSGKRAEALKLLLQEEQFLRENEMAFELLEVLQLIKRHYEVEGNETLANKYSLMYYTTKDEFINKSRLGKMDEAKLNLELEQTRERVREMSYRQKMQSLMLWSAIIITLLALGILAVLYVNYRKTKRTNRLLYEKNIALLNANKELSVPQPKSPDEPAQEEPSQADLELLDKITAVMESSPEVFSEDFSLNRLAELVGSNSKYVSRAINSCKQCNFNVLLNDYRIKEACRRLMDTDTYGNYTIEGIANSVGYKSRSNFTSIFKESVGLTPSAFQKLSRDGVSEPDRTE